MVDVLMVEDDEELARSTTEYLEFFDVDAHYVTSAEAATKFLSRNEVGLVLVDVGLPGEDGFSFCRRVRAESDVPIIFVSARHGDIDQITGLTAGADDYITKPYSLGVLLAKVRRVLSRGSTTGTESDQGSTLPADPGFQDDHLVVDAELDRVYVGGDEVRLRAMEHRLLRHLVANRGRVVAKAELFERVWGDPIAGDGTLTVTVRRLRTAIEPDPDEPSYIRTVWGRGYLFDPPSDASDDD